MSSDVSIAASHGADGRQRRRREQLERHLAVPDGLVNGTVGRLVLRLEQRFDLFVGLVDGPGAAGFLLGLAAQAQGRFGKALLLAIGRDGAPMNRSCETRRQRAAVLVPGFAISILHAARPIICAFFQCRRARARLSHPKLGASACPEWLTDTGSRMILKRARSSGGRGSRLGGPSSRRSCPRSGERSLDGPPPTWSLGPF